MIVVKVELRNANKGGEVTELARMHICNEGGTHDLGSYGVYVMRGRSKAQLDDAAKHRNHQHTGNLTEWPRLRLHVWNLVLASLLACGYRGPMPHEHNQRPMKAYK